MVEHRAESLLLSDCARRSAPGFSFLWALFRRKLRIRARVLRKEDASVQAEAPEGLRVNDL
jgi:hypothetical protein